MWNSACDIIITGKRLIGTEWRTKSQFCDYHRLYIMDSGRAVISSTGQTSTLTAGSATIIPGYRNIAYHCEQSMLISWVHFRCQDPHAEAIMNDLPGIIELERERYSQWESILDQLAGKNSLQDAKLVAQTQSLLSWILGDLVAPKLNQEQADDSEDWRRRLAPALQFMRHHCCEHPDLATIAASVDLSPNYFHHQFKQLFHQTPRQFLEYQRLQLGLELLRQPAMRIAEVAEHLGYPDQFSFSRAMRRRYGQAPSSLRKSLRSSAP